MENEENVICQAFNFDYEIQEHYFIGEKFIGVDIVKELKSGQLVDRIQQEKITMYMDGLVKEMFEVLGTKTTKYRAVELGDKNFSLYFLIDKDAYHKAMDNFKNWAYAKEIDQFIRYKLYDPNEEKSESDKEHSKDKECGCECLRCDVISNARDLKENNDLTEYEAFKIATLMQRNEMLDNIFGAIVHLSEQFKNRVKKPKK